MDDSRVRNASELLAAFFDADKLRRGGKYAEFFSSWKFLVGERLAAHSRVVDVERGGLVVEADHPGWIQLLQLRQAEILEGISRRFPELGLRSIVFRLTRDGEAGQGPAGDDAAIPERMGPFGPGGRAPGNKEAAGEAGSSGEGRETESGSAEDSRAASTLDAIGDPTLRGLLGSLKKAVEGEE